MELCSTNAINFGLEFGQLLLAVRKPVPLLLGVESGKRDNKGKKRRWGARGLERLLMSRKGSARYL